MLRADTDVFTTFEGDNTVLLQLVAKGLLTSYRDTFGDLDMLGIVRFGARQIAASVIERTAARSLIRRLIDATPGRDDDTNLMDRGLHLRMFENRERHVLDGLARRLHKAGGTGADAFTVFNEAQDHVLTGRSCPRRPVCSRGVRRWNRRLQGRGGQDDPGQALRSVCHVEPRS